MSDLAKAIVQRQPKDGADIKLSLSNGAVLMGVPSIDGNCLRIQDPHSPNRYTLVNPAFIVSAELPVPPRMPDELEEND